MEDLEQQQQQQQQQLQPQSLTFNDRIGFIGAGQARNPGNISFLCPGCWRCTRAAA